MQPLGADLEDLGRCAVDGEPEVVRPMLAHDDLTHDAVAGLEVRHAGPDLEDLTRPLVPGDDRIGHRDV